jgi:signal transduction histidine kinase
VNRAVSALRYVRGVRGSIVALLVIVVAMPLISLWATFQIGQLGNKITTVDNARLRLSRALRYVLDEESGVRAYVNTREPLFLEPYHSGEPYLRTDLSTLPQQFQSAGLDVSPQLGEFARLHRIWLTSVALPLLANPDRANAVQLQEAGKRIIDKLRANVETIHVEAAGFTNRASRGMFDVMIISGLLAVVWIGIVGAFTILFERRAQRREMELVLSLIDERESVERLSDWRSRLLAMLAHDFKSQLAVIIGAAHLLEDFPHRRGDPDLLGSVRAAGYSLAEMADNAILLARAQERRLVLQRTAFDVNEIVGTVVQRYGVQREVRVRSEGRAAVIDGDRSYVTRVLDNIIGNAVKYSDFPVDVRIAQENERVLVSVTDRGVGIAEADLPHIFEEFWRSETLQWSKRGSGVGLFIVKQIMEAHDGGIQVESELGRGTTVTLQFPCAVLSKLPPVPNATPQKSNVANSPV